MKPRFAAQLFAFLAVILASASAVAEDHRIISNMSNFQTDLRFTFQSHNNNTAYIRSGQTLRMRRGRQYAIWLYQHYIDLAPVSISAGSGVSTVRGQTIGGKLSKVLLPLAGNVMAPSGAVSAVAHVKYNVPIGATRTLRFSAPGSTRTVIIKVTCDEGLDRSRSIRLSTLRLSKTALRANETANMAVGFELPAKCVPQPITFNLPDCFRMVNPVRNTLVRAVTLNWELSDGQGRSFTVKADAGCRKPNRNLPIRVTSGGVQKRANIRFVQPLRGPTIRKLKPTHSVPNIRR